MTYTCRECDFTGLTLHHKCPECGGVGMMRLDQGDVDWKAKEREKAIGVMAQRIYEATCAVWLMSSNCENSFDDIYRAAMRCAREYYNREQQDDARGIDSAKHG